MSEKYESYAIEEDEDSFVGEMSKEDANSLVNKEIYVEFNYDNDGVKGKLIDIYKSGATRIVIQSGNEQYEDRELHEVSYYEVL